MADFKELILLCLAGTRSCTIKGIRDLYYGDAIKLFIKGVPDADVASLQVDLFTETSPAGLLAQKKPTTGPAVAAFTAVTDRPGEFYCSLDLLTSEIDDYLTDQGQKPGDPVPAHLIVSDDNGVWADVGMPLYHSPAYSAVTSPPLVNDPFVTESELATALEDYLLLTDAIGKSALNTDLLAVQAMATGNAAQRELKFDALITALVSATT